MKVIRLNLLNYQAKDPDCMEFYSNKIAKIPQKGKAFYIILTKREWNLTLGEKRHENEKSTKYFIQRYNAIPGSIAMMYDEKGIECYDCDILGVQQWFYTKLYNKKTPKPSVSVCFHSHRGETLTAYWFFWTEYIRWGTDCWWIIWSSSRYAEW